MPLRVNVKTDWDSKETKLDEVYPGEFSHMPYIKGDPAGEFSVPFVHIFHCRFDDNGGLVYRIDEPDINREYESEEEMIEDAEVVTEVYWLTRAEITIPLGAIIVEHFVSVASFQSN